MNETDLLSVRFGSGHDRIESIQAMFRESEAMLVAEAAPVDLSLFREGWCRVLMFAIFDYWFERPATTKFKSARDWIFYSGDSAPNSFDNVASFLDLCPKTLQRAITRRRSEFADDPRRARAAMYLVRGQGKGMRIGLPIEVEDEESEEVV